MSCPTCTGPVTRTRTRGRPRTYCSARCRERAKAARAAARLAARRAAHPRPRQQGRRFPFEPIERFASIEVRKRSTSADSVGLTVAVAELLGVTDRTVWRWRQTGLMRSTADEVAIRLDLHPGLVWPDWWTS